MKRPTKGKPRMPAAKVQRASKKRPVTPTDADLRRMVKGDAAAGALRWLVQALQRALSQVGPTSKR